VWTGLDAARSVRPYVRFRPLSRAFGRRDRSRTASEASAWRAVGASCRGKLHDDRDLPNQDALGWNVDDASGLVVAVSDGHGSAAHFRSDAGARAAVDAAIEVLRGRPRDRELASRLLGAWRTRVEADIVAHPFSNEEQAVFTQHGWGDPLEAYGATLVAFAVYADEILYLQVGDGDLLRVSRDGVTERIFEKDPALATNQTYSLCEPEAEQRVRFRFDPRGSRDPALLLAATDGYVNSFSRDRDFLDVGATWLQSLRERGVEAIGGRLAQMLKETSDHGSMDDITLALLVDTQFLASPRDAN